MRRVSSTLTSIYSLVVSHGETGRFYFNEVTNELIVLLQLPVYFAVYVRRIGSVNKNLKNIAKSYRSRERSDVINASLDESKFDSSYFLRFKLDHLDESYEFFLKVVRIEAEGEIENPVVVPIGDTGFPELEVDQYIKLCINEIFLNHQDYLGKTDSAKCWRVILDSLKSGLYSQSAFLEMEKSRLLETKAELSESKINSWYNSSLQHFDSVYRNNSKFLTYKLELEEYTGLQVSEATAIDEKTWFQSIVPDALTTTFKKLSRSTDVLKEENKISNYFMMARSYSKAASKRAAKYTGNIHLLMNDWLMESIKSYLKGLKKSNWRVKRFFDFPDEIKFHGHKRESLLVSLDNWFWDNVENGRLSQIVNSLVTPITSCSESFTDIVFESAHCVIKRPLSCSGLHRIKNNELHSGNLSHLDETKSHKLKKALKRAVCYHYIFSGMAGDYSDNKNFNKEMELLISPIEVGGRVWAVVCNLIYVDAKDYQNINRELFNKRYHYLRTIRRKLGRNLRRKLQNEHLKKIEEVYERVFYTFRQIKKTQSTQNLLHDLCIAEFLISKLPHFSPYPIPIFLNEESYEEIISEEYGRKQALLLIEDERRSPSLDTGEKALTLGSRRMFELIKMPTLDLNTGKVRKVACLGVLEDSIFPRTHLKKSFISTKRYQEVISEAYHNSIYEDR